MKELIREYLGDDSDRNFFRFSLTCQVCGKQWHSTPVHFTKADQTAQTDAKQIIYDTLWEREHRQALDHAISDAAHHFNLCPVCKRLTCNDCFLICDDLDMCHDCAQRLQETGEPTSFVGWKR